MASGSLPPPPPLPRPYLSSGIFEAEEEEEEMMKTAGSEAERWLNQSRVRRCQTTMEHADLLLALLLALSQTSVQPVFRKSWYRSSSRVTLTLILLTGDEEEEEEEVHSEEDEDSRWDRRIKVCSRILWLTTATFTSCRWLRLWTFRLNVDLWRVLFKHVDSTVYNNVSCL